MSNLWVHPETGHVLSHQKENYEPLLIFPKVMEAISDLAVHQAPGGKITDTMKKGEKIRIVATTYDNKWALLPSLLFIPMEHLKQYEEPKRKSWIWHYLPFSYNQNK